MELLNIFSKYKQKIIDSIIVISIVFSAFEIPARLVLNFPIPDILEYIIILISVIFAFHFTIEIQAFYQKFKSKKNILFLWTMRKDVFWLVVDFVSILPYDLLYYYEVFPFNLRFLLLFRVLRILEISRYHLLFTKTTHPLLVSAGKTRLMYLIFWILVVIHFVTCGWIFIKSFEEPIANYGSVYISAFYWTVTTFTTIGYGDITPQSDIERIYVTMVMILGAGIYGYTIGNVAHLLTNIDAAKVQFVQKMERIHAFLSYRGIPKDLQEKILKYYEYLWQNRRGYDESSVLSELPSSIQMKVALFLNKDIFEKIPIFSGANEMIINELALNLKPVIYTPGDIIFRKGEAGDEMYFISRGHVDILDAEAKNVVVTLTEGSFFGEIALLISTPRTATVRASDYCDLYTLNKATFDSVLAMFPEFAKKVQEIANARIKEVQVASKKSKQKQTPKPRTPKKRVS
ncbi:MAG: cyclic nucleotide-binding domain-containing protein [Leptospiraceae bacterium]|nr:cyclic nucleotide-binding domain-containing protein [Leptospiraceae bacterium]MCP5493976.1 cyclic nucleotide-binding domain-containing protein [Leptospiraceae bacterium]